MVRILVFTQHDQGYIGMGTDQRLHLGLEGPLVIADSPPFQEDQGRVVTI